MPPVPMPPVPKPCSAATIPIDGWHYTETQLRAIFKKHDKNKDNRLSKAELKEAFAELGALIPGYRAWRGIAVADSNGDGLISEDELNKLINYAYSLGYAVH